MTKPETYVRQTFEWVNSVEVPSEQYLMILDLGDQLPLFWLRSIDAEDEEE